MAMVLGELIERLEAMRDKYDAEGLHDDMLAIQVATPNGSYPLSWEIVGVEDVPERGGHGVCLWITTERDAHTPLAPTECLPPERTPVSP